MSLRDLSVSKRECVPVWPPGTCFEQELGAMPASLAITTMGIIAGASKLFDPSRPCSIAEVGPFALSKEGQAAVPSLCAPLQARKSLA